MAGGQRLISWLHPYSTSCAHGPLIGHPNWVGCDIHPPPQRTRRPCWSNSLIQCQPIRHVMRPIPGPQAHAYVRTLTRVIVQERSLLAHDRTSSADPYAMSCVPFQDHMHHAPYARTLTCTRNREVGSDTICNTPPTKVAPPSPFVGASTRIHNTLLTLSCSLRVKGLTRGCYGWWTKA
jgi:hypothetical protein